MAEMKRKADDISEEDVVVSIEEATAQATKALRAVGWDAKNAALQAEIKSRSLGSPVAPQSDSRSRSQHAAASHAASSSPSSTYAAQAARSKWPVPANSSPLASPSPRRVQPMGLEALLRQQR